MPMTRREYRIRNADGTCDYRMIFTSYSAALSHAPWGSTIQYREVSEWTDMPPGQAAITRIGESAVTRVKGRKAPQDVQELFERGRQIIAEGGRD